MQSRSARSRHTQILKVVRRVRSRWRLRILLRGLAIVLGAGLITFLFSVFGLEHFRFSPKAVLAFRWMLWLTGAGLLARYLIWPLSRRVTDEQAALYLEEHEPSLESSVLSAMDTGKGTSTPGVSEAFVDRLVETALQKSRAVNNGARIEQRGLYRTSGALAAISFAAVAVIGLGPAQLRHGASALLNPAVDPSSVNPYSISVSPGDVVIARGSDQLITAHLEGFRSAEVQVYFRSEGTTNFDAMSMLPGEEADFELLLYGLGENTEYFVESSGIRSATYRVEVADLPYVDRLELEYRFPAYAGLSPRIVEDGGDIAALRGTKVIVRVFPTMLTPGGRILLDGAPVDLSEAEDGTWTGSIRVEKVGFYEVELMRTDGELVPASPKYTIDVLADQPPSVSFSKPGRDTRASNIEEVFLEARADDDYGVDALTLAYSVNGEAEQSIRLFSAGGRPIPEVTAGHTLFLEELGLEPGDLVSYYAVASDNRRGGDRSEVASDIYFIQIRPFRVDYRQSEQQGGGGQGGGQPEQALSELQRQVVAATFNLDRDRADYFPGEYEENLVSVRLSQSRVREQVEALHQRLVSRGIGGGDPRFQRITELLPQAVDAMEEAEAHLERGDVKAAISPEQKALIRLQKAEETYEATVQQDGQQGGGGGGGATAEDLADLFELELDKLKNQYETVQRGERQQASEQIDELLQKLKELSRRQQQEAERQRRRAEARQGSGSGGGRTQRQLAEATEEAARQLQRLARETGDQQLEETARQLRQASEAMRRSASSHGSEGTAEAGAAQDRLAEAQRRLQQNRVERLRRDAQDALRRAESLVREQEDIKEGMSRLGEGDINQQLEKARRLFERKEAQAREVADLERQLDRIAADARQEQQRDASDRLTEAANSIRDNKLKERVRYSRGLIQARDPEFTEEFEEGTATAIDELRDRITKGTEAINESGDEDGRAEALDRTRDLVRGMESLGRRLEERGQGGRSDQAQEGQIRQFRSEVRERAAEVRDLQRVLDEQDIDSRQLADVAQALRSLDRARGFEDTAELARLQAQVLEGLKQLEFGLRRELEGSAVDQAFLAGSEDVPAGFRKLVEEYYRSLSRPPREGN
ncbi:MAG: hypothetical protein BMS9Abin29_0274 [Gemmatimonadota bacterium]|nr:MAG: hypothetical protein BMS9Abin29_0274 [Gemmatimonadota bacterium]